MAEEAEKKQEEQSAEAVSAPKDKGKLLSLIFMVVNLAVIGGGCFSIYSSTLGYSKPSVTESDLNAEVEAFQKSLRQKPVIYTLGTFNTNLDGVPKRMIRVQINLEMLDAEGFEEVVGLGAEAKDSVIRILNQKKFQQIESVQGKLRLKNEIIVAVNDFLERGVVKDIYFTDFAVQAH